MPNRMLRASLFVSLAFTLAGCPSPNSPSPGSLPTAYDGATKAGAPMPAATTAPMGAPMAPEAAMGGADMRGGAGTAGASANEQVQSPLKAGSVDDNAKFEDYMSYLEGYAGPAMRAYDVSTRHIMQVAGSDGKTVANATVAVKVGDKTVFTGRSYADGQLLFHPRAFADAVQATEFTVTATHGEATVTETFKAGEEGVWKLALPQAVAKPAPKLDVLFLIDATGSMGGEIRRLQSTLQTISDRIRALEGQPEVRFGLVSYRDQGDEYVTRKADFTADVAAFQRDLNAVEAGGGGDTPEDLESGLQVAVNSLGWNEADAVKLTFVVADAAPHIDYPQAVPYTTSMQNAAAKGIKLYTIGASGLPAEGEYVMRQLAQTTMAQYLFVTRGGDSESGGGPVSATVDKFTEGRLDDIVVDIVKAELSSLGK